MANSDADEASDYNTQIIRGFQANGGRVGGMLAGATLILIRTDPRREPALRLAAQATGLGAQLHRRQP